MQMVPLLRLFSQGQSSKTMVTLGAQTTMIRKDGELLGYGTKTSLCARLGKVADGETRHAICVGERKSNAMGACRNAHTVSTTRRIASSRRWKRREILQRGTYECIHVGVSGINIFYRAKYIEGLENRLGRMEALLKMSGLIPDDDGGKTDLGMLEKRLAEKAGPNSDSSRRNSLKALNGTESHHSTPQNQDMHSSPRTSAASPGSEKDKEKEKEKESEVEALSDMMCSLVTNNCGETRYIGNLFVVMFMIWDS